MCLLLRMYVICVFFFFFASRRRHTRFDCDWSSDVCSSDLGLMKFERMPFLAMVKEAKMRGFVSPGQLLTIEAKIEHEGSGFAVTSAKARVGTELKCSADLTFRHIPFPDPALRVHMDAMAKKIGFP